MATALQTRISAPHNDRLPMKHDNPAAGQKLPWYKAAARRPADRNYVPRYDLG